MFTTATMVYIMLALLPCHEKGGMLFSYGKIHLFIGHRLQGTLAVLLCLAIGFSSMVLAND